MTASKFLRASICLLLAAFPHSITAAELTGEDILKSSQIAYDALASYSDNSTAESDQKGERKEATYSTHLLRPNLYKMEWAVKDPDSSFKLTGVLRSDGTACLITISSGSSTDAMPPTKMSNLREGLGALILGSGIEIGTDVPSIFFPKETGGVGLLAAVLKPNPQKTTTINKKADEKIGPTDCFTVSITKVAHMKMSGGKTEEVTDNTQLWIGKEDFLIRQFRTTFPGLINQGPMTMTITHHDVSANPHLTPKDFSG